MDFSNFNFLQIILPPILALIIPIIWNFASYPISFLREQAMKKPLPVEINLNIKELQKNKNQDIINALNRAKFRCLIVRYGTDQYIMSMANDQEKYDGRLRNKIIEGKLDKEQQIVKFLIPLHKRIGTQFKFFLDAKDEKDANIILQEKNFKHIYDLSKASSSMHSYRIFFLVDIYGEVETIDGLKNNMLFPV